MTDRDINRVRKALPLRRDSDFVADKKIKRIKRFIKRRLDLNFGKGFEIPESEDELTDEGIISDAEARLKEIARDLAELREG